MPPGATLQTPHCHEDGLVFLLGDQHARFGSDGRLAMGDTVLPVLPSLDRRQVEPETKVEMIPGGVRYLGDGGATWRFVPENLKPTLVQLQSDILWVRAGATLWSCTSAEGCSERIHMPSAMMAAMALDDGSGFWLVTSDGIWLTSMASGELVLKQQAKVSAVCARKDLRVWVLGGQVQDETEVFWLSADSGTFKHWAPMALWGAHLSAHPQDFGVDDFSRYLGQSPTPSHAPSLVAAMSQDARAPVRRLAANYVELLPDQRLTPVLWLLSRDVDAEIREIGFKEIVSRCERRRDGVCVGLLRQLVGFDDEMAWRARNSLLDYDVRAALEGADRGYKEDVLARLRVQYEGMGQSGTRALDLLCEDPEPEIRRQARELVRFLVP